MLRKVGFAIVLLGLSLAAQAQQRTDTGATDARAVAAERVARNYHQRIAVEIAGSGQARDLALAAALQDMATADPEQGSAGDADAQAWRQAAARQAGADVLANALLMMGGGDGIDALREQAARRWAQAEPGNIAPRLFQQDGVDALLANAPSFDRFDLHMYDQVRWIQQTLVQHAPTANERSVMFGDEAVPIEEHAAISAMGLWAAVAIPSLQELVQACGGQALRATPTRRADCGHLARTLVGYSDSSLGRMLGIDLLGRMAGDASGRAEAQALRRRMDWQMLEWGRISEQQPRDGAPQFARLLADPQVRTEQDLIERILGEAGVSPYPPTGWQPPRR